MAFDNSQNTSSPHLPPADESHHHGRRPGDKHSWLKLTRTSPGRRTAPEGGGRSPGKTEQPVGAVRLSEGLPLGRGNPRRPSSAITIIVGGAVLLLLLRPSLSQLLGAAALPIPASDTIPGSSKNNTHTKPANEKNNPLEIEAGAVPPSPKESSRLAAAAAVAVETSPQTLSAEAPPLLEQPGLTAQRGPGARWEPGRHPPRSPGANLERLSRPRRRPPPPRGARPGPGLTGGARRCGGSGARTTDGRTDGWTAAAGAGTAAAGAGGRRRRCRGPATSQCGRASSAAPRAPQQTRAGGGSPGAAGAEPARREAGRGAGAPLGWGRGHRCPGFRGRRPLALQCAGCPPPRPASPLSLTDGDPPRSAPRAARAPSAPPRRPVPPPALLPEAVSEPALSSVPFALVPLLPLPPPNWLSPLLPSYFLPRFSLSPPPPSPAWRPLPPEMKSPLTVIPASTAATSLVPKPFQGSSLSREKRLREGGGRGQRDMGTVLGNCCASGAPGSVLRSWHSPQPPILPRPTPGLPTLEDFAKEGRARGLCPECSVLKCGWWMEGTLV